MTIPLIGRMKMLASASWYYRSEARRNTCDRQEVCHPSDADDSRSRGPEQPNCALGEASSGSLIECNP